MSNEDKPENAHDASIEKHVVSSSVLGYESPFQTPAVETPSADFRAPQSVSGVIGIISTLTAITIACSMNIGFITIGLPNIAKYLQLSNELLLWPALVYS